MKKTRWLASLMAILICTISMITYATPNGFIRRDGQRLTLNGKEITLRGVCFGNQVWQWVYAEIPVKHHSEIDCERVKSMGMNVIRFYMNYKTFEDDNNPMVYKESGFKWLDQNIEWARKNGIYLILNMHVPQGGYQSLGGGNALWENEENQKRFVALWKAIAERYRNEPVIAGYDLMNEPMVPKSRKQWEDLAQKAVDAIRSADTNHLIVVERILGINGQVWTYEDPDNFFLVHDDNTMYEFHFYCPGEYTYQCADWMGMKEAGTYPDDQAPIKLGDPRVCQGLHRNKQYLETMLNSSLEFGRKNNVPLYVGEFGLYKECFVKGRGGINWVSDMLDLLIKYKLNFTYHTYHESAFGIYTNDEGLPDPKYARTDLIELFKNKLGSTK